ncbi:MAG: hypothetical protein C4348_00760 [Patescibacteria group bacterium]
MAKNRFYIYLEGKEELGDIVDLIRKSLGEEIILVVPSSLKSLNHKTNLEILKREIESLGKKVFIESDDEKFLNLAQQIGFEIFLKEYEVSELKVVDVKPPKKKEEKKDKEEKPPTGLKIIKEEKPKRKINIPFKKIIFFSLILIFSFLSLNFVLGFLRTKVVVKISLDKNNYEFNEIVNLNEDALNIDYENKILPAKKISIERLVTEEMVPTGEEIFSGLSNLKITFYNKSPYSFPLVEGTRLDYNGNIFKTIKRIEVPKGEENNPSSVNSEAFPFEIKDKNLKIKKGEKLKIIALEGKEIEPGKLWSDYLIVEANEDYSPEIKSKLKVVTQDDLTSIKLQLENKIKKTLQDELALKYPNEYYIYDESLLTVKIQNLSHNVGEKTDKLLAMGSGKIETMVFNKKEAENLIKELIFRKLGNDREYFMISKINIKDLALVNYDFKNKTMIVSFKGTALIHPNLSEEILKEKIKGKTIEEAKEYFSKIKGVNNVNIKIWPYWRDRFPQDPKRIEIYLE